MALTKEQVEELKPKPNNLDAKKNGSRHKKFTKLHGDSGYELEAIPPENLQDILRIAIDSVLDVKAFNAEIDAEKQDAAHLEGIHRVMQTQMASVDLGK